MMEEQWIERWETAMGVGSRLSTFMSSPDARTVIRELESCGNIKGDVETLAFLLIFYVWPETAETKKLPSPHALRKAARSFEQCRRTIAKLADTGLLGTPEAVQQTCDQLQKWATHLNLKGRGWPMVAVGTLWIGAIPPAAKRHRAKRQVVSFLTYYCHTIGCPIPPWRMITQFLILAKLAPSSATEKHLATWWSNVLRREHRTGDAKSLAPYQHDQLTLFELFKNHVWSAS